MLELIGRPERVSAYCVAQNLSLTRNSFRVELSGAIVI